MSKVRTLLVGAALVAAAASSAQAFTVANTADGTFAGIDTIQFAAGSTLAVNANPYGPGGAGNPNQLLYQAYASGLYNAGGQEVNSTNGYEITAVASLWEKSTGLGTSGATFTLDGTHASTLNLYYQTPGDAVVANGSGFTNGTLILSAVVTNLNGVFNQQDTNGNGFFDNQDQGQGSTQITARVTSFNSFYLQGLSVGNTFEFEAYTNTPPKFVTTTAMWDGTVPNYYTGSNNLFGTEDILMASQGRMSAPVPEPGTMMLLGAGLVGLAVVSKRRAKK